MKVERVTIRRPSCPMGRFSVCPVRAQMRRVGRFWRFAFSIKSISCVFSMACGGSTPPSSTKRPVVKSHGYKPNFCLIRKTSRRTPLRRREGPFSKFKIPRCGRGHSSTSAVGPFRRRNFSAIPLPTPPRRLRARPLFDRWTLWAAWRQIPWDPSGRRQSDTG